jgi:hypothetical protein
LVSTKVVKIQELKGNEYPKINNKKISLSIILIITVLVILDVLFSQLNCVFPDSLPFHHVYAQNSDMMESIKKEQPEYETRVPAASYDALIANNYPYPIQFVQKLDPGPAIIHDGIAILKNSYSEDIQFKKWGFPNNLNLYNFPGPNENITLLYIDGETSDDTAGFMSVPLKYTERYFSMNFGSIFKYPETAQINVQLVTVGDKNEYNLNFVNGRLGYEGWLENNYYKKILSNSSHLVDLAELISLKGDRYSYVKQININVEKNTHVNIFQFRLDFGNSTLNTPALINDGQSYIVNGRVFQGVPVSNEFKFLFDDWQFRQILNQQFVTNPSDDHIIATNSWNTLKVIKPKDNATNNFLINLVSEKTFSLWDLPILTVIMHLDIYNSLINSGSPKDILFVITVVLLIVLVFRKGKSIPINIKSGNE